MYTIYHIEGVKIGCSVNPKARVKGQGYSSFHVLEVHDDIEVASKREIELQIEYGYGRDCTVPYTKSATFGTHEGRSKGGKINGPIQGKKNLENGHMSRMGKIGGKISGKIAGQKNVDSGHISNLGKIWGSINGSINGKKNVESGQVGKAGKIGGKKNVESGHISNLGKIYGSINMKKANSIERTCPYCSKTIKGPSYKRWHGQKCKLAPVTT